MWGDGFDAGMSFGSAIVLTAGQDYSLQAVLRSTGSARVHLSLAGVVVATTNAPVVFANETVSVTATWHLYSVNFTAAVSTDNATLTIVSSGRHAAYSIGAVSLMPADSFHGMRRDVVAALKALRFTGLLRYPGGCFAPFYNWRNGLLPPLQRAPIATPPDYCTAVAGGVNAYSDGFFENGINTDDYMALVAEVGAVAAITIPLQFGTPAEIQNAADWVEYCNGDAAMTKGGALRAARGHPAPYNVRYWYLGNEMSQQARYQDYPVDVRPTRPPTAAEYAAMLAPLAAAMLAVDPSLRLLTVEGGVAWDTAWAASVGPKIYATSFHAGYFAMDPQTSAEFTQAAKHPTAVFYPLAAALRQSLDANNATARVRISADEWGLGPPWKVGRFNVGHAMYGASFLAGAINSAEALGIAFTNYFEPVNEGAITVTARAANPTPLGLVMPMYAGFAGQPLLLLDGQAADDDVYTVAGVEVPTVSLDTDNTLVVVAALTLTIANRNATTPYNVAVRLLGGVCHSDTITVEALEPDVVSPTGVFVRRTWTAMLPANHSFTFTLAPYSVYRLQLQCVVSACANAVINSSHAALAQCA